MMFILSDKRSLSNCRPIAFDRIKSLRNVGMLQKDAFCVIFGRIKPTILLLFYFQVAYFFHERNPSLLFLQSNKS